MHLAQNCLSQILGILKSPPSKTSKEQSFDQAAVGCESSLPDVHVDNLPGMRPPWMSAEMQCLHNEVVSCDSHRTLPMQVATAIRGAIILAKMSVVPVRRGYWGNKIGSVHTVPTKVSKAPSLSFCTEPWELFVACSSARQGNLRLSCSEQLRVASCTDAAHPTLSMT